MRQRKMFYEQSSQPPHSLHPQHDCTTINHDLVYNSSEEIRPIDFFDLNTWKRLSANWTLLREEIIEFEEIYHVPSLSERYGQKPIMYRNNDGHFIRDEIIFEETDPIVIEDILNEVIQINGVYKYQRTISRSRHEKRVFKKLKKRSVYLTEVAYQQYKDATNLQSDERTSATGVDSVLRDNLEILDQPHQLRYITEVRLPPAGSHAIISNEQEIKMTPSVKTTLQPQEKQRPLVSKMLTVTDVFKQPDFTNSNRVENGLLSDIIRWHLIENDNTDAHYDFENDKDEQHNVILTETSSQNEPKLTILNELINWHHDISDSTVQFNSTNAEVMQPNHAESTFSNIEKGYYQAKKDNIEDDSQDRHIVKIDTNKLIPDVTECQQSSNTSQYATIVQPYQISSKDSIDRSKTNSETVNFKDFILPHNTFEQMMEDDYANEKDDKQTTKKNEISIDLNTDLDVSSSETNDLQNFSYSTTIFENENVLDRIWPSNILQKKLSSACESEICPSKISYGQNADHLKETAMPKSELHKVDLIFSNSDEVRPSVTGHGKERDPVLNSSTDEECDSIEHISAQVSKEIIPESSESANDVCDHEPFEPIVIALQLPNITTKAKHLMALQRRDILSSNLAFLRVRNQNLKIKRYLECENELDSFSNDKYNKLNCKMLSRDDNCRLLVTVSDKHLVSDSVDGKMDNTVKETLAYRDKITQNIADGTDSKTVPPCVIGVKHYYHPLKNTIIRNYIKNYLKTWQKSLKVNNCKAEICAHEFSKKLNKSDNSEEMKVDNEVKSIDKAKTRLKYLNYLEPTGRHYHSIIKNQIEKPQLIERNVVLSTNIISSEEVNNFEVVDSKQDAIETTVNKIENDNVVQNVVEYNAGNEIIETNEGNVESEDEQEKHTNYIENIIFSHKNFNTFKAPEQIALITPQETAELVYTKESDNTSEDEQDKRTNYIENIIFSHKNFNTFKAPEQIALITPQETAEVAYTKESNKINVIYDYSYQFISNIISSYLFILENDKRKLSVDSKPEESFALAVEKYRLNETNEKINNDATELLHQSSKDDILSEPSTENIRRILLHHKTISDINAPCTLMEQLPCQQIPTLIHKSTFETDNVDAEQLHRIKCNETACDLKSPGLDDTFDCEYHNDLDIQQPHSVYTIRDIIESHRVFSNIKLEKPSLQHLVQAPLRKDKDNNDGIQKNKIDGNLSKIQNVIVQEPAMNRLAGKLISNISHIMLAHVDNISVKSIPAEVVVFDSETKEISDNNYINSVETKDHIVFTNNKTENFTNRASADRDYSKADITACNINLKSSCSHISSLLENHNQLIKGKCLLNVAKLKPEANDYDFHETEFVTDEKLSANKNTDYQGTKKANDHEIYDDSSWISTDDLSKISNENESEEFRVIEKRQESSRVEDDKESMEISEIQEDDFSKLSLSTSTSSDNGNLNLNIIDILICHHNFKPVRSTKQKRLRLANSLPFLPQKPKISNILHIMEDMKQTIRYKLKQEQPENDNIHENLNDKEKSILADKSKPEDVDLISSKHFKNDEIHENLNYKSKSILADKSKPKDVDLIPYKQCENIHEILNDKEKSILADKSKPEDVDLISPKQPGNIHENLNDKEKSILADKSKPEDVELISSKHFENDEIHENLNYKSKSILVDKSKPEDVDLIPHKQCENIHEILNDKSKSMLIDKSKPEDVELIPPKLPGNIHENLDDKEKSILADKSKPEDVELISPKQPGNIHENLNDREKSILADKSKSEDVELIFPKQPGNIHENLNDKEKSILADKSKSEYVELIFPKQPGNIHENLNDKEKSKLADKSKPKDVELIFPKQPGNIHENLNDKEKYILADKSKSEDVELIFPKQPGNIHENLNDKEKSVLADKLKSEDATVELISTCKLENDKNQCLLTDEFNTNNDLSVDQSEPLVGTRINNYYEQQFENNNSVESLVLKDTPIHPIMRNVKYINLDKFRSSLSDSFRECFSTSLKTSDMDNDVTNIMLPRVDQIVYQRMHSNNDIPATDIIPLYAEVFELGKRLTSVSADSSKMPACTQESTLIEGENNESEKCSLIEASTVYDQLNNEITQFTESIEKAAPGFHGKDIKDSNTTTTIHDFTNPLFSNGQSTRERESNEHRLSAANAYVLQDLCSEVIKPDTDAQATKFTRNEGIDSLIKEKTHTVVNGKHLSKIPVAKIKQIVTPSYTKAVIPESVQTDYSDNKSQAKLSKNLMVNTSLDTLVNRGNELKHKIRLDTDQLKQIKDKLQQDLAIINKDNISDPANNQQSHHTSKQSLGAPHVRKTRLVPDHKGKQQLGAFYDVKHPVEAPHTNKQRFEADHDVKHSLGQNNGENKMQTGLKSSNRIPKLTEKVYSSRNDSISSSSSSGDKEKATNQLIRERRLREAQKKLESFQPEYVRNWLHSHENTDRNRTDPNKCSKICGDTVSDDDDLLNDIVLQKVTSSSSKQFDTSSDSSNNNSNSSIRQRR